MFLGIYLVLVELIFFNILIDGIDTYFPLHKTKIVGAPRRRTLEPLELQVLLLRDILHVHVEIMLMLLFMWGVIPALHI